MVDVRPFLEARIEWVRTAGYSMPPDAVERAIEAGRDWEQQRVRGAKPEGILTAFEAMERALMEMAE